MALPERFWLESFGFTKKRNVPAQSRDTLTKATVALVIATAGLIVVGLLSFGVSLLQWQAIRGQLDAMQADQRPWIKIHRVIKGEAMDLSSPIAIFPVRFTIENVGRSPAFNVQFDVRMQPYADNVEQNANALCSQLKMMSTQNENLGQVLFPNTSVADDELGGFGGHMAAAVTHESVLNAARPNPVLKNDLSVPVFVYGCATYRAGSENKQHQTGFIFMSAQIIGDHSDTFGLDVTKPIEAEKLLLFETQQGSGLTD